MNNRFRSLTGVALVLFALLAVGGSPAWAAKTYTMAQGDTLWDLSSKFYGDPTFYPVFLEVNEIDNPRTIPTGKVILVPSYDEMRKIAQEPDPAKRKALIQSAVGSPPTTPTAPAPTPDPAVSSSEPTTPGAPAGPIDPNEVSMANILKGPKVGADKIKRVETAPNNR